MDRMIYTALTGAREAMRGQMMVSQNLANVGTTGFRAVSQSVATAPVNGPGFQSRANPVAQADTFDTTSGSMNQTGGTMDIAVQGSGWIAVQDSSGKEAYTRAGDLHTNSSGFLENGAGHLVLGGGGPISLPQFQQIFIGTGGEISIVPQGQKPDTLVQVDRIKLVNPPASQLIRGPDGVFRMNDGSEASPDADVHVASGQLETSNVNPTVALVQMIEMSRAYEMQVRSMKAAEDNDTAAQSLMRNSG